MRNLTNSTVDNTDNVPNEYRNAEYFVIIVTCTLAITLNILTLVATNLSSRKLGTHYVFVCNQCLADVVFSTASIVAMTWFVWWGSLVGDSSHQNMLWFFLPSLVNTSASLVLMNLCAISLDHAIAIHSPLRYKSLVTRRRAFIITGSMYIILLFSLCLFAIPQKGMDILYKGLATEAVVLFIITFLTMTTVYGYIFRVARSTARNRPFKTNKAMTSLWIIASFIVCYGIDLLLFGIEVFDNVAHVTTCRRVTMVLPSVNCLVDPMIYAVRLPKIQKGFRRMWKYSCGQESETELAKSPTQAIELSDTHSQDRPPYVSN